MSLQSLVHLLILSSLMTNQMLLKQNKWISPTKLWTLSCLFLLSVTGSVSWSQSPQSYMVKTPFKSPIASPWKLAIAEKLGVQANVFKKEFNFPLSGEGIIERSNFIFEPPLLEGMSKYDNYSLSVQLPQLSSEKFELLKSHFKADISWQSNKHYELIDFLPAPAQAAYENHYISNRSKQTSSSMSWAHELAGDSSQIDWISRVSNCWSSAYEYLRRSTSEYTVHYVSEEMMSKTLVDDKYSTQVIKLSKKDIRSLYTEANPNANWAKIQPGDLLMFYQKVGMYGTTVEVLAHVSIAIDYNLVFEKTNTGSNFPYRLAFLRDGIANLINMQNGNPENPSDDDLDSLKLVVRRFNKIPLPSAQAQFAIARAPGLMLDLSLLPSNQRPPQKITENHSAVAEMSLGGGINNESLYEIVKFSLKKNPSTGRFEFVK